MSETEKRLDDLFACSDQIYPIIDQQVGPEFRHRVMLRQAVQAVATHLRVGLSSESMNQAGEAIMRVFAFHIRQSGLPVAGIEGWQGLATPLDQNTTATFDPRIDTLANLYADTTRVTRDRNGGFETDSSHAVHMALLAGLYVAEYHPQLALNTVLVYAVLHDIVEAYSGDTASFGLSSEGQAQKDAIEAAAFNRIKSELGQDYPGFVQAIEAYEHLGDSESRFIKSFEKLDPGFAWLYTHPRKMLADLPHITSREIHKSFRVAAARKVAKYCWEFPDVLKLYFELSRRVDAHIRLPDEPDNFTPDTSDVDKLEQLIFSELTPAQ